MEKNGGFKMKKQENFQSCIQKQQLLDLFELYKPYIPNVYRQVFMEFVQKEDKEKDENYPHYQVVVDYLRKFDECVKAGKSRPIFPKKIRRTLRQKSTMVHYLDSILPSTIESMLLRNPRLDREAKQFICLYYGIDGRKHSIAEIQKRNPNLTESYILSKVYRTVKELRKGEQEIQEEQSQSAQFLKQLQEKFILNQYLLTATERKVVSNYYGLSGVKKSLLELANEMYMSQSNVQKLLNHGTYTVLHSDVFRQGEMVESLTVLRDGKVQESDLRPLRLIVKQVLDTEEIPINDAEKQILNRYYGFHTSKVMSLQELSILYHIPVEELQPYFIELVKYVLNYVDRKQFKTEDHKKLEKRMIK